MNDYQALQFRQKINSSVDEVKLILDRQRSQGILAADAAPHRFEDKFLLVNQVTNCLGISIFSSLFSIGLTREKLAILKKWAENSAVSFRFVKETACRFVKEATRKEESPRSVEVEYSIGILSGKSTSKVVTTITEFFYNYEVSFRIEAFRGLGTNAEDTLELVTRSSRMECVSRTKEFPFPESTTNTNEVNCSWFIRHLQLDENSSVNFDFQIDRSDRKTRTATRNPQIEEAISSMVNLRCWCQAVHQFFSQAVRGSMTQFQNESYSKLDTTQWTTEDVFVPILPIFRSGEMSDVSQEDSNSQTISTSATATADNTTAVVVSGKQKQDPVIDGADIGSLLNGHESSLTRKLAVIDESFPPSSQLMNNLISQLEARLIVIMNHIMDIINMHRQSMDYMEEMLRSQIIAAIGREVTPQDFDKYMIFHYRKLYREEFAPKPWSMSVRRTPRHAPEGTVRIEIERSASDGGWQPIDTFSKTWSSEEVTPMSFPINAATTISFTGSRHVHGYINHAFQAPRSSACNLQLRLIAAARQFSSFMVVLGRISSATSFDPKHAFVVENKEEMIVPLNGETFPSAREFRDAIASLSPAQQRFCKAYRAMQLESTLFGVLLIQIKPPMERVLRLFPDSLTKEIKLSQDLMRLFLEYQISSDLLCCDDDVEDATGENAVSANRVQTVKNNVKRVQEMIDVQIQQEVADAKTSRAYQGTDLLDLNDVQVLEEFAASPPALRSRSIASSAAPAASRRILTMKSAMPLPPPSAPAVMFSAPPPPSAPAAATAAPGGSMVGASLTAGSKANSNQVQQQQQQPSDQPTQNDVSADSTEGDVLLDMTKFPALLDAAFDTLDPDYHAVRPTILHTGATWQFVKQKPLALNGGGNSSNNGSSNNGATTAVNEDMQGRHRQKAFDLLDAMTRSGALLLTDCDLHVVIAATHAFDRSLMNTLVQGNENPIEHVERSSVILSRTLHQLPGQQLVLPAHTQRLMGANPQLF